MDAFANLLFNIPGEPRSVATTFDGHPMAKKGMSGGALTAAFTSSFIGAAFAIVLVTFFAPLLIWGLQPGPMLFKERPDFVWGLIASMYTGNVIGVLVVLLFVPLFAAILRMPFAILIPLIVYVCAIGAYAVNTSTTDIWYIMLFGIVGYLFKKLDYPIAPMVLALVLGDTAESALRQSLIMSQGSPLIFVASPISALLTAVSLWLLFSPAIHPLLQRWRSGRRP